MLAEVGDKRIGVLFEGDGGVGAEGGGLLEGFGVASGGDDARCAEAAGDLHGEVSGDAGRAEDEDALSGGELCARGERGPRGHAGVHHGGGRNVIDRVRQRQCHPRLSDGALGEGAIEIAGPSKVDTMAVGQAADAIDSGDEVELAGAAVVGSGWRGRGRWDAAQRR